MVRPKLVETPEFKDAVDTAVKEAMSKLGTQLAEARGVAGAGKDIAEDGDFVQRLAMAIAELSDQGTQRKRVAPEILAKRAAARERMGALIIDAHAKGEKPEYRVISKTYLAEQMIEPYRLDQASKRPVPTEIFWTGVPNECMRPLNPVARGIFDEFMASIGGSTETVATADKRPIWVTQKGLVVKGVASGQRREVGNAGDPIPDPFGDMLTVKSAVDPTKEFVAVLGTIAAPARQADTAPAK